MTHAINVVFFSGQFSAFRWFILQTEAEEVVHGVIGRLTQSLKKLQKTLDEVGQPTEDSVQKPEPETPR